MQPQPIPLVHWRNFCIGGSEIELRRDTLLENGRLNRKKILANGKKRRRGMRK